MATLKFFTRTGSKNKMVPVRCRLIDGRRFDAYAKTGYMVMPHHWNNRAEVVKNIVDATYKDEVNSKLRKLKDHIMDQYAKLTTTPDKIWLTKTIKSYNNPEKKEKDRVITLFSFIQNFIDKAPTRVTPKTNRPACYKQIREYERTFYYLKEFAKDKKRKIDFKDIDLNFYYDFVAYLQSLDLAQNTIGKKIQTLKIFMYAASDMGLTDNRQFMSHRFTVISEETESIYLNEAELQAIYELDLTGSHLEKVKDLFIVGCWTGLRFSDWDKITPANIDNGFLELKQAKTGAAVVIPLHSTVEAIMNKYNGQLPKIISNQKFNDYLKLVAQKAGLTEKVHKAITKGGVKTSIAYEKWKLVTTHTGRRSFATNLYKVGVQSLTIMQITGHKTEAAFLKYIKVTPREHAEKLKEFWRNRPVMKVK